METTLKKLQSYGVPQRLAKKIIAYNREIVSIDLIQGGHCLLIECREGIQLNTLQLFRKGSKLQLPYGRERISKYINAWKLGMIRG